MDQTRLDAIPGDRVVVKKSPLYHPQNHFKNPFSSQQSIVQRIARVGQKSDKPLILVVDSGPLYDPLARALQDTGLPVFRSANQAVYVLGKYIQGRLKTATYKPSIPRPSSISR